MCVLLEMLVYCFTKWLDAKLLCLQSAKNNVFMLANHHARIFMQDNTHHRSDFMVQRPHNMKQICYQNQHISYFDQHTP